MDRAAKIAALRALDAEGLREWAGPRIFVRGQQYARGHVTDLAHTSDGALLAWVHGSERYATLVDIDEHGPESFCTCPYEDVCKHAVAVVLAFQRLDAAAPLPTVSSQDRRLKLLEYEDGGVADAPDEALQTYLAAQPHPQLLRLLLDLAVQFPEVHQALRTRQVLTSNNSQLLVRDIERLLEQARSTRSSYRGWDDDDDAGDLPDYAGIKDRLERLLAQGRADDVIAFGEELIQSAARQIEAMDEVDDEVISDARDCLRVVFQAMPRGSDPLDAQLLTVIDWVRADHYDLCLHADEFLEQAADPAAWGRVADQLIKRLAPPPERAERSVTRMVWGAVARAPHERWWHSRERTELAEWAATALKRAGRGEEVIGLWMREAEQNGSYVPLVQQLVAAGRIAEAEEWIAKGISAAEGADPGVASQLRGLQVQLWEQAGDWARVAARRANLFFHSPSYASLCALRAAAEQAGAWPAVREVALHYLETGERPGHVPQPGQPARPWLPLPELETAMIEPPARQPLATFPLTSVLVDLALEEGRPDDALRWYRQPGAAWLGSGYAVKVAQAIDRSHPEEAMAIWQRLAEREIGSAQVSAYPVAGEHLRRLHALLKREGRLDEWRGYLTTLRQQHARKRRFLEVLDQLQRL